MFRYGSRTGTTSTTTTEDSTDHSSERRIRRLRLTLHTGQNGQEETKATTSDAEEKAANGAWKKKNGLIQRERPAGRESPEQHLGAVTNGVRETAAPQPQGPKVYGVVQRTGSDKQQEVMACEWSVNHLRDEMRYIREVRDSLEKVRERMYGQFGGMQQSMQKLTQEMRASNSQRHTLESEVRVRTAAMDSFDQMNSSLISSNIELQKSVLESCQNRLSNRDELRTLRSTCEKIEETLNEREQQLAAAQTENQTLKLQVEATQEASSQAVQELTSRLQTQYEERLQREQKKHMGEIEKLQAQIDEYVRRLEEAEKNAKIAEAKIAERDLRISEVERLLGCMGEEKGQLLRKLRDCEQRLQLIQRTDETDAIVAKRAKEVKEEASDLRERIKHLNDMVFCQQRKVKGMIEEVASLRDKVAQKDMFISELLDRIAIVECENNELGDKLKYFMCVQSEPRHVLETREIGVGCDLLPRPEMPISSAQPTNESIPVQSQPQSTPAHLLTTISQPRTFQSGPMPPSRLESSLLRYTPFEYTQYLQSNQSRTPTSPTLSDSGAQSTAQSNTDAQISHMASGPDEFTPTPSYSRPRTRPSQIYTPFMKLLETTAKINVE